jgi:hypothetical protein
VALGDEVVAVTMFTVHQREILLRRLTRAIAWHQIPQTYRNDAIQIANAVIGELEVSGYSAAAQRRAVEKIVADIEETA